MIMETHVFKKIGRPHMPCVYPYLYNNTCYVQLEDITKPVPIFLSDHGKHVYMVLKTGVYRTLVYVSQGKDCFAFPLKDKDKTDYMHSHYINWEKI